MGDLGPQVALLSPGALFSSSKLRKQKEVYALIKGSAPGCGHCTPVHTPSARTGHMTTPSCTESWEMQSLAEKPLLCPPQHCWYCRLGESLWRGFPVHSSMFNSISGFNPLDNSSGTSPFLVMMTKNICRHCQMSPGKKSCP